MLIQYYQEAYTFVLTYTFVSDILYSSTQGVIGLKIFWSAETRRKARLFRSVALNIILSGQSERYPSCEQTLMKQIDKSIDNSEKEFEAWGQDYDYEGNALSVVYNITFDLVTSGQYHLYTGMLKPDGEQLKKICVFTLQKARENGTISEEQRDEQLAALRDGIKSVG